MAAIVGTDGEGLIAPAERSALGVFALRVGGAGLAYLAQVLLARLMGASDYGVFATVWVWATIVGHGSLWGIGQAASRFLPLYRSSGDVDLARGYPAFGFALVTASALLIAGAGALALHLGRVWVGEPFVLPIAAALLVLPFFAVQDYLDEVARSFGWPGLAIAPPYVGRPALIVLFMVAAARAAPQRNRSWRCFARLPRRFPPSWCCRRSSSGGGCGARCRQGIERFGRPPGARRPCRSPSPTSRSWDWPPWT